MSALKHLHKYRRMRNGKYYHCIDPLCSHYTSRELLYGKRALCGICEKEFILDPEALRRAMPRCLECTDSKKAKTFRVAKNLVEEIFGESPIKEI